MNRSNEGRFSMRGLTSGFVAICAAALAFAGADASARTLEVGPGHDLTLPSAAAAVAQAGDRIEIEPGEYIDCAVWTADRLVIVGRGAGAVVTLKTCEGKAVFVIRGDDVTIRNLTFSHARVPDANGAGIRAEGRNLTVFNSRFIENENGILAGPNPASTIRIYDSEFRRNGSCEKVCAHGIYIDAIALLHIERSTFTETRTGHQIKSRALSTRLIDNDISDGAEGTSSYLVDLPDGGSLEMEGNRLEKGPLSDNGTAAIVIGAESARQKTSKLVFKNNTFVNNTDAHTIFVRNLTGVRAILLENHLIGSVTPLSGNGKVR